MQAKINYEFSGILWKDSPGGWVFISIPKNISKEIRENLQWQEEGWGRMKATAIIKEIKWDTAIWFDTEIRKKACLKLDDVIPVSISI